VGQVSKGVAWICVFTTLCTGCSSAVLVRPTGEEKQKMYLGKVAYVVTMDSTKYTYETPPTVVNDTIVNGFRRIPLSDVAYASVVYDPRSSAVTWSYSIIYIVTKDGTRYDFASPPTLVKDTVVGELEHAPGDSTRNWSVAIALSDVAYVADSTDTTNWITWGMVGVAIVAGYVVVVYLASTNRGW
jgi:hypothetical protein